MTPAGRLPCWAAGWLLMALCSLLAASGQQADKAGLQEAALLRSITELPPWRSDRVFTLQEWRAYGACAREFQAASADQRSQAVAAYQLWLQKKGTSLSDDGTGYLPSQILLLLRISYKPESDPGAVKMHPLKGKDNVLEMTNTADGGSGIYLPSSDFKNMHRVCPSRDLSSCKVRLPDGTLEPLVN